MEYARASDLPAFITQQLVELLTKYGAKEAAERASACPPAHTRQHKERARAVWAGLMVGEWGHGKIEKPYCLANTTSVW